MLSTRYLIEELRELKYIINSNTDYVGHIINRVLVINKVDKLLTELMKQLTQEKNERKKIICKKKQEKEKKLKKQLILSEQKKYTRLLDIKHNKK